MFLCLILLYYHLNESPPILTAFLSCHRSLWTRSTYISCARIVDVSAKHVIHSYIIRVHALQLFLREWREGERRVEGVIRGHPRPFGWEFHKHTGNVGVQGATVQDKKKEVWMQTLYWDFFHLREYGHPSLHVINL